MFNVCIRYGRHLDNCGKDADGSRPSLLRMVMAAALGERPRDFGRYPCRLFDERVFAFLDLMLATMCGGPGESVCLLSTFRFRVLLISDAKVLSV